MPENKPINLLCQYYLDNNQDISPLEAERVVIYASERGDLLAPLTLSLNSKIVKYY